MSHSDNYIEQRLAEALAQSQQNLYQASKLIVSWMEEDDLLRDALTRPFFHNLAIHSLQRYLRQKAAPHGAGLSGEQMAALIDHIAAQKQPQKAAAAPRKPEWQKAPETAEIVKSESGLTKTAPQEQAIREIIGAFQTKKPGTGTET